jgi:hypothetical protein
MGQHLPVGPLHDVGSLRVSGHVGQNVERSSSARAVVGGSSISAFGMNNASCELDASGSGFSMVLRSHEHSDELVVSITDEKCL